MSNLEEAKAFLQQKAGDRSLYEHLSEVLLKVLHEKPNDPVAAFEHISSLVKRTGFSGDSVGASYVGSSEAQEIKEAEQQLLEARSQLMRPKEAADGVTAEPVQDLIDQANYLEWANISFGREETYRIYLALKQLASSTTVSNLRLWGKLLGKEGDYIIAEGQAEAEEEEEEGKKDSLGNTIEPTGKGANKFTYWVCSVAGGPWTRLPNVTPEQVIIARKVRRFLTGNLDAAVGGHPPFPGREKSFIRALIAIISAETVISPDGVFVQSEDEESPFDINPNEEEFEAPDLSDLSNWKHHVLPLNAIGRCTPNPPELNEEGEEIEDPNAPEPPAVLASIAEDGDEENPGWALRGYPSSSQGEEPNYSFVVAKSRRWPGAVAVGIGKRFLNCYVGYGQPYREEAYAPSLPSDIPQEFDVNAEDAEFVEQKDVLEDPDAGKQQEGEGEEEEED